MPLPHTVGLFAMSEPVAVELKNGRNVLRFKRTADSNSKGITIREFKLIPWEDRLTVLAEDAPTTEDSDTSSPVQQLLGLPLLQTLAGISADGQLQPLPMDLSITSSKVRLLEAKGSGILAFQAVGGDKIVAVSLDDLSLKDHALLARLAARLRPDDPTANALAGSYMSALGELPLAEDYQRKAGAEAVERFTIILKSAGK
jgi:hypothetical protein